MDSSCFPFCPGYMPKSLSTSFRTQTFHCLPSCPSHRPRVTRMLRLRCASRLWGFTLTARTAFGNLTSFSCAMVVERRAGPCHNREFLTGLWTLSRLLIQAKVWNALCTLELTQQGLSPPSEHGQEVTFSHWTWKLLRQTCVTSVCVFVFERV